MTSAWLTDLLFIILLQQADHSIHIAGLLRLDIEESTANSIYVTVWASPYLPLHMGKTENVYTMLEDHFGRQLQVCLPQVIKIDYLEIFAL